MLGLLCHQRGLLPLHAACLRVGDAAVALSGAPGAGKSTLAAALAQRGHSLLADDVCVVDPVASGGPVVLPAFPSLKLRPDALDLLGVSPDGLEKPEEAKLAFLGQQFALQVLHYAAHYADSDFGIVVHEGKPIGRLYLYRTHRELRIVDISLAPEWRGKGIGTALLEAVFAEAAATAVKVTIHVERSNPARRLYRRLGFREKAANGPYRLMAWEPHPPEPTCPK